MTFQRITFGNIGTHGVRMLTVSRLGRSFNRQSIQIIDRVRVDSGSNGGLN